MKHALLPLAALAALAAQAAAAHAQDAPAEAEKWRAIAEAALEERLARDVNHGRAKNVIVFWADGMGPTLAAAARIYQGQLRGEEGEENFLTFERFPYTGFVKTYSTDGQIPDSAATASAVMTGVKTHNGAVSVYADAEDCATVPENLMEALRPSGRAIGVVTTTYIVDASPASVYAHAPSRRWLTPGAIPESAAGCRAISDQLIDADPDVAMGGGRAVFMPEEAADPEDGEGARRDGRNLIEEWREKDGRRAYVTSAEELRSANLRRTDKLLGLFARGSMVFEEESPDDGSSNPTLGEMTAAALEILEKDDDGYFLFVEHEGTDDLQHGGFVKRAMDALLELNAAIDVALQNVDLSETLIVVSADHAQSLTFGGYPDKGNPILGLVREDGEIALARDGKPFTTLGFYAGPRSWEGPRPDLSGVDTGADDFIPYAAVPTGSVTHSGADVAVYAIGPWSDLFTGVMEQNALSALIRHAAGAE